MKRIIICVVGMTIAFGACTNSKKKQEKKTEEVKAELIFRKLTNENDIKDYYQVILDFEIQENDGFQLFYTEDYLLTFTEEQSIRKEIIGSDKRQQVIFDLPKDVLLDRIRLDVGGNRNQSYIKINFLKIRYGKNEIHLSEEKIPEYLISNENISYSLNIKKFNLEVVEKEGKTTYDPNFVCSPELIRLLSNL